MQRREFLLAAAAGIAGGISLTGCGAEDQPSAGRPVRAQDRDPSESRLLLAFFSRAGENYWDGGRRMLQVGNTEVLARKLAARLDCDVHEIKATDPYPEDYEETRARNVREQDGDARPEIANPLTSIAHYETVILASPVWNVRPPMIMATFAESHDFSGKTVIPATTHAMSGLGSAPAGYAAACKGANIADGLAIRGEEVRGADRQIESWLQSAHPQMFPLKGIR
jgi:flavodoxin